VTPAGRARLFAASAALVTVPLGLGSRRYGAALPRFVAEYAGDALYATLVFFLLLFAAPRAPRARLAALAFALSALVEVSQASYFAQVAPLAAARATRLGRLVLGTTFVWSDFPCYAFGALLGLAVVRLALASPPRRSEA
jgi:hypothetical protein